MSKKETAIAFLRLASSGKVKEAYEKCIHPKFRHHNSYFKGDRDSLMKGMEESVKQFPDKVFEPIRALEDGNLVAIHGKVKLSEGSKWSVIHIFRFEQGKIIELWEASQQVLKGSPNENGIF
ncbi:nuclear transport factor 2 family protein [Candidatus Woesearchaeota archaeon]|nr:nuclear transport factor 2 family protein [Candidatus Woesearchaeota archaeon]